MKTTPLDAVRVHRFILAILLLLIFVNLADAADTPKPWIAMDRGPYFTASVESHLPARQMTPKGLIIRLQKDPPAYVLFDTDLLRYSAAWTGKSIDWRNVELDGSHQTWPSVAGDEVYGTPMMPGWAHAGSFLDPRTRYPSTQYHPEPVDWQNRAYGPLPHEWAQYKGLYLFEDRVILSYTVNGVPVLDSPGVEANPKLRLFSRTLNIAPSKSELTLEVLAWPGPQGGVTAQGSIVVSGEIPQDGRKLTAPAVASAAIGAPKGAKWELTAAGHVRLHLPPSETPVSLRLMTGRINSASDLQVIADTLAQSGATPPEDLSQFTHGGRPRWPTELVTQGTIGSGAGPYVSDRIVAPIDNPWHALMRFGGFDFFADGKRAAVCTWDGDVWTVDGIDGDLGKLIWRRIATGLFQPLGLKIVPDEHGKELIYVCCRDQITRLRDLNGDGETDFYECFNNDHQVTEHFHEFALGLQTDKEGNFYYNKSARHALDSVVPQHGTVLKVSKDGSKTEVICGGFRAANGFGISDSGELVNSDQEGYWTPANRINLLKPGGFYGNMWAYAARTRSIADLYDPPIVWLPVKVDRSPAEELWCTSSKWGPLQGKMIHTSYGTGKVFLIVYETVNGVPQGAAVPIPGLVFNTGIMRARFHPANGQLYVAGMTGWSTDCAENTGFYRIRYTGQPVCLPETVHVLKDGISLTFTAPLDPATAADADSYGVQQWQYRWTQKYGSAHYSIADPNKEGQDDVEVAGVTLSGDHRTVTLRIPTIKPVMQMRIDVKVKDAAGKPVNLVIHNTINQVPR